MMQVIEELRSRWEGVHRPFMLFEDRELDFDTVLRSRTAPLDDLQAGDVVAVIGDFDPVSIATLLHLIDRRCVVVPLTIDTRADHAYFFESALVDFAVHGQVLQRIAPPPARHPLLDQLRQSGNGGLVLFSTGTTGRPKAILHDMSKFLIRFRTERPTFRTLNFLLFDHIGGINTLLHTLFNKGEVVCPSERSVQSVVHAIGLHSVELLPTSPTFLRMLLLSDLVPEKIAPSLRVITYGTERMDQSTLCQLCELLPDVQFRQTYGMSELGILRVKSRGSDSLWMKVGGEGVQTRIIDKVLEINSANRMLGYLNAESPFDAEGWYHTKDLVETDGEWIKIVGRTSEFISVGGVKFLPSEIERVALSHPDIAEAKAIGRPNPITGQHVELTVQLKQDRQIERAALKKFLANQLSEHMVPHRIKLGSVAYNHRFKKQ